MKFKDANPNYRLNDIILIGKSGGTPISTNPLYYNGEIPFLSISDMTSQGKNIFFTEKNISKIGLDNSTAWLLPINSLILSMYASYGLVSINKIELATSQAMFNMVLKKDVNIEYVYYYLTYLKDSNFYESLVSTGTQSNLNANKIKNIPIYIPNTLEQNNISQLFSFLDREISLQEKILQNLNKFKQSLLQKMFI